VELPEDIEAPTKENDPETNWDTSPKACRRRLEATLVMARGPLTSRKLAQLAILEDGTQARTIILALNEHYDRVGRAFHIKRVAGGYQMLTRPQFSNWISRLEHIPKKPRLSRPAMETLTIVAYRQPIIRADIEAIRGASCGEMLRQLLERGLVKIAGRSPELGRPFLYATTKEFLTCFGFNTIKNIPRAKQLAGKGLPEWASSSDNFTDNPQSTSSVEESSDV
jgi:segregation and condensation protein B